jgi:hypothetical protein
MNQVDCIGHRVENYPGPAEYTGSLADRTGKTVIRTMDAGPAFACGQDGILPFDNACNRSCRDGT